MRPFILKLMYWGEKLFFLDIDRTSDIIKTNSGSKLFKIIRKDLYHTTSGVKVEYKRSNLWGLTYLLV